MNTNLDRTQIAANEALDMLGTPRSPRPVLTSQQWEELARYVEAKYAKLASMAIKGEGLMSNGLTGPSIEPQIIFWRASLAVSRKIAYDFRVGKGGPLNARTINQRTNP